MKMAGRITSKGQVTIPASVRKVLGLDVGDEVIFEVDREPGATQVRVRKSADFVALAGSVPVPEEWADAQWPHLREAAWSEQSQRRARPSA
jgi:AbrB family looped-hinge helix DNA binding protein